MLLKQSDLFGSLAAADRAVLARHMRSVELRKGETPIRQGDKPAALYLLASGTAEVMVQELEKARVVYRISPGETLGAVSLVTGETHAATATVITDVTAYCLDKADLVAAMAERPDLPPLLEAMVAEAARMHPDVELTIPQDAGEPDLFLKRVKAFFQTLET